MFRFIFLFLTVISSFSAFCEFNKTEKEEELKEQRAMETHFSQALQSFQKGDFSQSQQLFTDFIRQYPESQDVDQASFHLSLCMLRSFRLDEAEVILIKLSEKYRTGSFSDSVNDVLKELHDIRERMKFALNLERVKSDENGLNSIFELIRNGKNDEAVLELLQIPASDKNYLAFFYLGLAYEKKHETMVPECRTDYQALAMEAYENSLKIKEGLEAMYNLAFIYESRKQTAKALELFNQILKKYPDSDFSGPVREKLQQLR